MAKRRAFNVEEARNQLIDLLDNFVTLSSTSDLRSKVLTLIPAFRLLSEVGMSVIPNYSEYSARERILIYFRQNLLTIIDTEELMIVSGISEYPRRIRELRVQDGWPILSGQTVRSMLDAGEWEDEAIDVSRMRPDQYILLENEQDRDAAHRWGTINRIRKQNISVQDKIINYLRLNVGRHITGEELAYLANGATDWARRVRELRTEKGWPVRTKTSGRPDLPVGVYLLEEDKQAQEHDRKIDDSVRAAVLERDEFRCRKCGWNRNQKRPEDPRRLLELHHLEYHAAGGKNEEGNLITLCNVDHDVVHRDHMNKEQVFYWIGINSL
ncbi:hypothetical protein GCM10023187_30410 [Nibrella viscosa]|uniref:HNH domain-containing protein n=1 Tax=Nibrella viscosa TaxID=1084524 RepID=A0ABP8KKA6_9BACT